MVCSNIFIEHKMYLLQYFLYCQKLQNRGAGDFINDMRSVLMKGARTDVYSPLKLFDYIQRDLGRLWIVKRAQISSILQTSSLNFARVWSLEVCEQASRDPVPLSGVDDALLTFDLCQFVRKSKRQSGRMDRTAVYLKTITNKILLSIHTSGHQSQTIQTMNHENKKKQA